MVAGCQVLTTLGNEQHNKHLHWHVAVGDGVARFVPRGLTVIDVKFTDPLPGYRE